MLWIEVYIFPFACITAHDCTVRGVSIDGLNQKVVSAGADGTVKFWRFKSKQLLGGVKMDAFVAQIVLHRDR